MSEFIHAQARQQYERIRRDRPAPVDRSSRSQVTRGLPTSRAPNAARPIQGAPLLPRVWLVLVETLPTLCQGTPGRRGLLPSAGRAWPTTNGNCWRSTAHNWPRSNSSSRHSNFTRPCWHSRDHLRNTAPLLGRSPYSRDGDAEPGDGQTGRAVAGLRHPRPAQAPVAGCVSI